MTESARIAVPTFLPEKCRLKMRIHFCQNWVPKLGAKTSRISNGNIDGEIKTVTSRIMLVQPYTFFCDYSRLVLCVAIRVISFAPQACTTEPQ